MAPWVVPALFSLVGIVLLGNGAVELVRTLRFRRRAARAKGVVWEFLRVPSDMEDRVLLYRRIVFRAADKRRYDFTSRWRVWPGNRWHESDEVDVLYDPDEPTTAVIQEFRELFGIAAAYLGVGAFLLALALLLFIAANHGVPAS